MYQLFHYIKNCRTDSRVLKGKGHLLDQHVLVRVRVTVTIPGTVLIDPAVIIFAQERTGMGFYNVIAIFIQVQVSINELVLLHLQPFGNANPKPLIRIRGVRAQKVEVIGKDRSHLRVMLGDGYKTTKAVMFGAAGRQGELRPGMAIDVLAQLRVDRWNGADRLDVEIKDFRPAER